MSENGAGGGNGSGTASDGGAADGDADAPAWADDAFETDVAVRYADVDTYGHVNNAAYAGYLEEARIDYLGEVLDAADARALLRGGESGVGAVVANLSLDFRSPLELVDAVAVAVRVPRLGDASLPVEYAVRSDAGLHATGATTLVVVDRATGDARSIPDDWRDAIATHEGI